MNTLDHHFEKFTLGPLPSRRPVQEARVTINSKGLIYLNAYTYERLGSPKHVTLYYSRPDDAIAIEPTFPPTHETFPVTKKERGWKIFAWPFCQHYRLRIPTTLRFVEPEVNNGILVLKLSETVAIGFSKRGKPNIIQTTKGLQNRI